MVRGSRICVLPYDLTWHAEAARVNTSGDHNGPRPQHDILEVNEYLTSSLSASPIDKWFVGTGGRINREGLGVPSEDASIKDAISRARAALDQWDQTVHKVCWRVFANPALRRGA